MSLKTFFKKRLLQLQDYEEYKNFKYLAKLNSASLQVPVPVLSNDFVSFKHSGNIGDIIYALPAIFTLAQGKNIHLYLQAGQKGVYGKKVHPLGNLMLTEKMVELIAPLLLHQPTITKFTLYDNSVVIDFDMDIIRSQPFPLNRGNISRWYFYAFGITADLGLPWLKVIPDQDYKNHIVIARSQRYNAPGVSYSFLEKYADKVFIGVEAEWKEMQKMLPGIQFKKVENFLEMAAIIEGSKLFIGNQSFPFSLAEALKTTRVLEVYHQCPNVNVEGKNGYDFCYQPQFEKIVSDLMR